MKQKSHEHWMNLALDLALKGYYETSPNPVVGACVVKNNRLIASGYHKKYGGEHAEIVALKKAGREAKGSTLYVTLEPCSTWGKTPPCLERVVASGVKQVVIAQLDPNPVHQGGALSVLRKSKIKVVTGVLSDEAEYLNRAFLKWVTTGIPFVSLKMAQSLDGKIATQKGESKWITSKESRAYVQELRAGQDAVLIGKNTLLLDDPSLTVRLKSKKAESKPWRVVLDPKGEISPKAKVLKGSQHALIVIAESCFAKVAKKKTSKGTVFLPVKDKHGRIQLKDLLVKLGCFGIARLLVEGGGELAWSFLDKKLVDEFYWFVAPKFIGGRDSKTAVEGNGIKKLKDALNAEMEEVHLIGKDLLIRGRL